MIIEVGLHLAHIGRGQVANMNCEGMEDILESAVPEISAAVKSILRSGVNSWHGWRCFLFLFDR
jgi:hypothetical protein